MVRQGELPNPRDRASAPRLDGTDGTPFCCVYSYANNNDIVGAECVELNDNDLTAADCTAMVPDPLDPAAPLRQFGVVAECCRDCELLARKLIIAKCGNRSYLVGGGGVLDSSPVESPEDCCCGDVPRCVQVPGCNQVDCYPEPPDSGDRCHGRCLSMEYDDDGVEIPENRGLLCATKVQCCAADNSSCMERCYDSTVVVPVIGEELISPEPLIVAPTNQWAAMACTTDECGVCCTHVYNTDPDSPTYRESIMRLGVTSLTKEECEATEYDPNFLGPAFEPVPLGPRGDWVAQTDDTNVCNPPCCLEQQLGDAREANCYYTDQLFCDSCVGRCIDVTAENDPGMCPRQRCATKQGCCGDGNERCTAGLCGENALYRWEPMECGTDETTCGVCCKNIYIPTDAEPQAVECDVQTTTKSECERLIEHPTGDLVLYGNWFAYANCVACGDSVPCCRELDCPDNKITVCVDVPETDCDPCKGKCTDLETGEQRCASLNDCCGQNNEFCTDECGAPQYSWDPACADPVKCGTCCRVLYDAGTGAYLSAQCLSAEDAPTANECVYIAERDGQPDPAVAVEYEWKPFKTCSPTLCASQKCCGQSPRCPGVVGCIDIPRDDFCDPCLGRCRDLATGESECKTKQDCCGADGHLCIECPDGTGPQFTWDSCADTASKCGVCCELLYDANDALIGTACHEITYGECAAMSNTTWKAFETCDTVVCSPKTCCSDVCPDQIGCKIVDRYFDTCDECEGICQDVDQNEQPIPGSERCATIRECCSGDLRECVGYPPTCLETPKTKTWSPCGSPPARCFERCPAIVPTEEHPWPQTPLPANPDDPRQNRAVYWGPNGPGEIYSCGEPCPAARCLVPDEAHAGPLPIEYNIYASNLDYSIQIDAGVSIFTRPVAVLCSNIKYTISLLPGEVFELKGCPEDPSDPTLPPPPGPIYGHHIIPCKPADVEYIKITILEYESAEPGQIPRPDGPRCAFLGTGAWRFLFSSTYCPCIIPCTQPFTALEMQHAPKSKQAQHIKNILTLPLGYGVGTELKKLLAKIGITATPTCSCNKRAQFMDEQGIDWCKENIDLIVSWLREESEKRRLPFVDFAGKLLVKRAISLAEKAEKKRLAEEAQEDAADG